eukprot:TRINITY_DN48085_c0_g1_i1.p1 TRINITY_DN48085_c0_g1~~TRINITY_DN48085_c0_g1_i1.p1  ORF type:complete len:380 (+),score=15.75 TRINITY_DN48085_c0_g1_i1:54-1142(+)
MATRAYVVVSLFLFARARAFDQALGLSLAYLEKSVYCGKKLFNAWDVGDALLFGPKVDTSNVKFVSSWQTQAAAGVGHMNDPEGCFVAVRGTVGPTDGALNLQIAHRHFNPRSCRGCAVHYGFSQGYYSIKNSILKTLDKMDCKSRPIYLIGHSRGAAIMQYLLYDLLDMNFHVKVAYALESPRPGNGAFGRALREKVDAAGTDAYRISHYRDLVVHVPTKSLLYVHALPEIFYTTRASLEYKVCGVEDKSCSDQYSHVRQQTLEDHMWFANVNPCWCQNYTSLTPEIASQLRNAVPSQCAKVFNVHAGDRVWEGTCGWHIVRALQSGQGISSAIASAANDHPVECGQCASTASVLEGWIGI